MISNNISNMPFEIKMFFENQIQLAKLNRTITIQKRTIELEKSYKQLKKLHSNLNLSKRTMNCLLPIKIEKEI
jgi:hypothetical protein